MKIDMNLTPIKATISPLHTYILNTLP